MTTPALDLYGWQKEAARRAAGVNVTLTVDAETKVPIAGTNDGGRSFEIKLPAMPADATRDDFLIYRRSFLHELGHVARREVFAIQQRDGFKSGTRRWFCLNAIEDSAQERDMARANPGDRIALVEGNDALLARMVTQLAEQPAPGPEITDEQLDHARKVSALSALILKSSSDWCTQSGKWADAMLEVRDRTLPGTRALWDELEREGWWSACALSAIART
jgi:hypothetical protein